MLYKSFYRSPLGMLTLISNGNSLNYILFENDKFYENVKSKAIEKNLEIFNQTKNWLDKYFSSKKPNINKLNISLKGTTFQKKVWNILKTIPYGKTLTYKQIAQKLNINSPRAVGNAVGHNPLPVIIPCHRVIGKNNNLTGFSAGINNKIKLLKLEGIDITQYKIPKKIQRCKWCNLNNPIYVKYHDKEWGVPTYDDQKLFELLILETFQAGLSWECILNKRKNFKKALDNFDINKIIKYNQEKINQLIQNKGIIRNKLKIKALINNAKIFKQIQNEYGTFSKYIWHFTNSKIIYEINKTKSDLSDKISKDLKQKGMTFVGTTIIYSYIQAIGIINSHEKTCFKYKK